MSLENERLIDFAEAARNLPRTSAGRHMSVKTVYRWAAHGIKGVRLEAVKVGARWMTSVEACWRFFRELTTAETGRVSISDESVRQQLTEKGFK